MTVLRQGLLLLAAVALLAVAPSAATAKPVRAPRADTDHDGLMNRTERRAGTKPRRADSDRDGVRDGLEDRDRDGVDNLTEQRARTRPDKRDTDRDRVPDGLEDTDGDGLNNAGESAAGMDARHRDSDRDGVSDRDEHAGMIKSVAGTSISISLFGGGMLTASTDDFTDVLSGCAADDGGFDEADEDAGFDEDDLGEDTEPFDGEDAADDGPDDEGEASADDDVDFRAAAISSASCIAPGARVYQADVEDAVYLTLDLLGDE